MKLKFCSLWPILPLNNQLKWLKNAKTSLLCCFLQKHNAWPENSHSLASENLSYFPSQPSAASFSLMWGLPCPTFVSIPLMKAVVYIAGWGGLPWTEPSRMMSATAFSTWSLCGRCVCLRALEQQLKMCSSVLLLRHLGHGGDSASLLRNRLDELLQRQWIILTKFWAGYIKMYFSHLSPLFSCGFPSWLYSTLLLPFDIDYKCIFSTPITHQKSAHFRKVGLVVCCLFGQSGFSGFVFEETQKRQTGYI